MYIAEIFDHSLHGWIAVKNKIIHLEEEAFGAGAFKKETIETDFLDLKNIIILLKNEETKNVIGFTYAKPREPETDDSPARPGETAWMWDTVIEEGHRGKGLLRLMMSALEQELKKRGFKYLERNALVANNFAENISKHYKERIIKSFPLDSEWGPQVFFRIKL